jgi:hypothetical protein
MIHDGRAGALHGKHVLTCTLRVRWATFVGWGWVWVGALCIPQSALGGRARPSLFSVSYIGLGSEKCRVIMCVCAARPPCVAYIICALALAFAGGYVLRIGLLLTFIGYGY